MAAANLVNQHEALVDFLEDLLTEETQAEAPAESAEPMSDVTPAVVAEAPPAEGVAEAPVTEPAAAEIVDEAGRRLIIPNWGQQAFAAMVFKVRDLSLAIPVQELAGVLDWQTARVQQQAGSMLLLGQTEHAGQPVRVVDTARLIFPEGKLAELAEREGKPSLTRIVLIDKGKIGLACDEVYELIDIQPSQVTWRSEQTRRKWLAGTMLEEMIVLLDAATMADILTDRPG